METFLISIGVGAVLLMFIFMLALDNDRLQKEIDDIKEKIRDGR